MRRVIDQVEVIVGGGLLIALCLVAMAQVGSRYVMDSPLAWTEELGRLLFVWLVFVGASLALKRNEHFALEVIVDAFPERWRRWTRSLGLLLVALFCVMLVWLGAVMAKDNWDVRTPVLEVRRTWAYLAVPVGGLLMLGRTVQGFVALWRKPGEMESAGAA